VNGPHADLEIQWTSGLFAPIQLVALASKGGQAPWILDSLKMLILTELILTDRGPDPIFGKAQLGSCRWGGIRHSIDESAGLILGPPAGIRQRSMRYGDVLRFSIDDEIE
jgi:hypothetical protein